MAEDGSRSPAYSVPALEKGLDILECLSLRRVPMTQAQIARELGRGPSELFRMLTVLERRGYLHREPISGAYDLTLRLYELGQAHSPYDFLLRAARLPMGDLAIEIAQSCHLAVLEHAQLIVLHREEGKTRVRLSVAVGSTIPALESVSGRLLLAHLPPDECLETLHRETNFDALSKADQQRLWDRLATIRTRGYEAARGEQTEGVSDLAVLIGTSTSRTRAALAVPALTRNHEAFLAEGLPALHRCAAAISRAAGILDPTGAQSGDGHSAIGALTSEPAGQAVTPSNSVQRAD